MSYYDFDDDFDELGGVKKLPVRATKVVKKTPVKTFSTNILQQRQSTNVIDQRSTRIVGARTVQIEGYLTWNTYFHLAAFVPTNIKAALEKNGFDVYAVYGRERDTANSQYGFQISVTVSNQYSIQDVKNSLIYVLSNTVALPDSVRILSAKYLF